MDSPHGAAVTAEDFGLKGPRGWAFRGVRLDARTRRAHRDRGPVRLRPHLPAARPHRAGCAPPRATPRSAVCACRARWPPYAGSARSARCPGSANSTRPSRSPSTCASAPCCSAASTVRCAPCCGPAPSAPPQPGNRIDTALDAAGLDPATLPKAERTSVRDLERLEALRLSVALALIGRPRLLAVDDTDLKLSDAERAEAWELLRSVADSGTTVLAVCSQAPEDAVTVRTDTRHQRPPDRAARTPQTITEADADGRLRARRGPPRTTTRTTDRDDRPRGDGRCVRRNWPRLS